MIQNRLFATGIIGFAVSMLGCVTPALVALLAVLGVSGSMGWLDYILLPAMGLFAGLTGYAIFCHLRRRQTQDIEPTA
jgi:mercuric ion transport protein